MVKSILKIVGVVSLSFLVCSTALAVTIPASVTLPGPIDIEPVITWITYVEGAADIWGSEVSLMNFDPLTLKTFDLGGGKEVAAFLPDHYYAVDVGYTYGAGSSISQITISYAEGSVPTGQTHGLGWKSTATFLKKSRLPDGSEKTEAIPGDLILGGKKLLKDIVGGASASLSTDLAGGWLRMYVGLVTLDPAASPADPSGAEVFSPGDISGAYSGTLTISTL